MTTTPRRTPEPTDESMPTLLLVSLATVLVGVIGVVAVAVTDAGWAVFLTLVALLVGLAIVARTMQRQLADQTGHD